MKSMVSLSLIYRLNAQVSFGPRLVEAKGVVCWDVVSPE